MELALIGLPQSGKTALLQALTRGRTEAASHGSSRMEINTGVTYMADSRLETLAGIFNPKKVTPIEIKYLDVQLLIVETSETGQGIAGQFLNAVQAVDALVHVVRSFKTRPFPTSREASRPGET